MNNGMEKQNSEYHLGFSRLPSIPVLFPPIEDELFSGWLDRIARVNGLNIDTFFRTFLNRPYHSYVRPLCIQGLSIICDANKNSRLFPDVITSMKKHSIYYASLPFNTVKRNIILAEDILRNQDERFFLPYLINGKFKTRNICPLCRKEDIEKYGTVIIHTAHQLPGVTCCWKHGVHLLQRTCNQSDWEITEASEQDQTTAYFMKRLLDHPVSLFKEETIRILEMRCNLEVGIEKMKQADFIKLIANAFSPDEFIKDAETYLKNREPGIPEEKYTLLCNSGAPILNVSCNECGHVFYIHQDAFRFGCGCPNCFKQADPTELLSGYLKKQNKAQFEIVKVNSDDTAVIKHKLCGRVFKRSTSFVAWKIASCPDCKNLKLNRVGEQSMANNGQKMTIIRYGGSDDIDVCFEDGSVVKHKSYESFLRGKISPTGHLHLRRRGEIRTMNNGMKARIIRYGSGVDLDVQFEDGYISRNKTYVNFITGGIGHPLLKKTIPGAISKRDERIGQEFTALCGMKMRIVAYYSTDNCTVEFEDGTRVCKKRYRNVRRGFVQYPSFEKTNKHEGIIYHSAEGLPIKVVEYRNYNDCDVAFEDGIVLQHKRIRLVREGKIKHPVTKVGETFTARNGMKMEVTAYRKYSDCNVRFQDGAVAEHISYGDIKKGLVRHPSRKHSVAFRGMERIGEEFTARNGMKIKIIAYRNAEDCDVQFEDGVIVTHRNYRYIKQGHVTYTKNESQDNNQKGIRCKKHGPRTKASERIGQEFTASNGMRFKIIGYQNANSCDVQFEDGTVVTGRSYQMIQKGSVRHPSVRNPKINKSAERIGQTFMSAAGMKMTVIGYKDSLHCDVQFEDGTIVRNKAYSLIKAGDVQHPLLSNYRLERVGREFTTRAGRKIQVIEYISAKDCTVQFDDGFVLPHVTYRNARMGTVLHPNLDHPNNWRGSSRIGEVHYAEDNGMKYRIIEYCNCNKVDIQFEDGKIVRNQKYHAIKAGKVKYEHKPQERYPRVEQSG